MTAPASKGRGSELEDGAKAAATELAGGLPGPNGGARGIDDPAKGGGEKRWEYRDRRWSDPHEVSLDTLLTRANEAAAAAAAAGEGERAAGCCAGAAPAPAALVIQRISASKEETATHVQREIFGQQ